VERERSKPRFTTKGYFLSFQRDRDFGGHGPRQEPGGNRAPTSLRPVQVRRVRRRQGQPDAHRGLDPRARDGPRLHSGFRSETLWAQSPREGLSHAGKKSATFRPGTGENMGPCENGAILRQWRHLATVATSCDSTTTSFDSGAILRR